jgi:hypothetical protein
LPKESVFLLTFGRPSDLKMMAAQAKKLDAFYYGNGCCGGFSPRFPC